MFELALEITLGMFAAQALFLICLKLLYGDKIFELYQRFSWLQRDIRSLTKEKDSQ